MVNAHNRPVRFKVYTSCKILLLTTVRLSVYELVEIQIVFLNLDRCVREVVSDELFDLYVLTQDCIL